MELAEGNCHAESVAGSKGSSARTQIVSEPATLLKFFLLPDELNLVKL